MIVSPRKAPCLIYPTLPQEPQIKYTDYHIFSCGITCKWFLLTQLLMPIHSIICQHSCPRLLFRLSIILLIYIWSQMFQTFLLFLSFGDMLGRDVLNIVMFLFHRWKWRCWFRSKEKITTKKKTGSIHSNSVPFVCLFVRSFVYFFIHSVTERQK